MAPNQPARIILGTHTVSTPPPSLCTSTSNPAQIGDTSAVPGVIHISDTPAVKSFLDIFASYGHTDLDTAAAYVGSEDRLGKAGAGGRFTIHTKALIAPGSLTPDKIHESVAKSLAELRVPSVETLFLHAPGRDTPLADTLAGIDAEYRAGKFRQWGVSNYSIDEVKEILKIAQEKGYAKPSVYEGHYNLLVRGGEKDLFPLLRENGIKFFAYR